MHDVRLRAGASNGSLFHHFPTRRDLEVAVIAAGLAEHHATVLRVLTGARTARQGVRGVVLRHLGWVQDNRQIAPLLLAALPIPFPEASDDSVVTARRRSGADVAGWLRASGWTGHPELPTMNALWLGPANDLARGWLSTGQRPLSDTVAAVVADAAWSALRPHLRRGARAQGPGAVPPGPRRAHRDTGTRAR